MIKKGMKVKILAGKDKKKEGEVIEIDRKNSRAKIKGANIVKKHVKTTKEKKGGIVSKENFTDDQRNEVINELSSFIRYVSDDLRGSGQDNKPQPSSEAFGIWKPE